MCLWEAADHEQGEKSFKRNALNNAMDGSEDHLITRTAKEFWCENNMPDVREQIKLEVEAYLEEKPNAPVEDVFTLLRGYEDVAGGIGEMEEGQESEAALKDDEKVYDEDDEESDRTSEGGDDAVDDDDDDDAGGRNGVPSCGRDGNGVPSCAEEKDVRGDKGEGDVEKEKKGGGSK